MRRLHARLWPRLARPRARPRHPRTPRIVHGHELRDEFAWLGDEGSDEVEAQLRAEGAYTQAHLQPLVEEQMRLYRQLASTVPSDDESVHEPWGAYEYFTRTSAQRDLPRFCRRCRRGGGGEEVLLDLGALADRHGFASLGAFAVSPDHRLLAFTLDTSGAERFTLIVKDIASGEVHAHIAGALAVEWVDSERLVYTTTDHRGRASAVLLHELGGGGGGGGDALLLEEDDEEWVLDIAATKARRWLTLSASSRTASEVRLLDTTAPRAPPTLVAARTPGLTYFVEQLHRDWLLLIANDGRAAGDHAEEASASPPRGLTLSIAPIASLPAAQPLWQPLWPPGKSNGEQRTAPSPPPVDAIEDIDVFDGWLALYQRRAAVPVVSVLRLDTPASSAQTSSPPTDSAEPPPTSSAESMPPPLPPLPTEQAVGRASSLFGWLTSRLWPSRAAFPPTPPPVWPAPQSPPSPPPAVLSYHEVALPSRGAPCRVVPAANRDAASRDLRFSHSSPTTPTCDFAYDVEGRTLTLLRQQPFPFASPATATAATTTAAASADADASQALPWLHCELRYAPAPDGALVPVTLLHRRGLSLCPAAREGRPALLTVYGAYGAVVHAEWRAELAVLAAEGAVVAIAHVRGGGELGAAWHAAGRRERKRNSAADLLTVARALHRWGYATPRRTAAQADSAGALALAAAVHAEPRCVGAAVLRSPFVDLSGASLDPSLPLTREEYAEWGDPADEAAWRAIRAACPYALAGDQEGGGRGGRGGRAGGGGGVRHPPMLLSVARHDARVSFTQALRYVARLRDRGSAGGEEESGCGGGDVDEEGADEERVEAPLLLHMRSGGHFGDGGRYRRLEALSQEYAFVLRSLDVNIGGRDTD